MFVAIAIIVVIVLAAVVVFATARRRVATDPEGHRTGELAHETVQRDQEGHAVTASEGGAGTAAEDAASDEARARADDARQAIGSGSTVPATTGARTPATFTPVDEQELGVSRRQFFNRALLTMVGLSVGAFGASAIAFLYAKSSGGFGGIINPGIGLKDTLAYIASQKQPYYVPEARTYLQVYPVADVPKAKKILAYNSVIPDMEKGILALYQKCVHLGCKVPWCPTSQWFECPCHGSKYSRVGEKKGGPAPRGLDRFVINISGDSMVIDTGVVITGPPLGTDTTGQGPEGPFCVGG